MYSNQEAYEEMCKKAEKYDELKEAVEKIKEDIKAVREEYDFININYLLEKIIDKHTEG